MPKLALNNIASGYATNSALNANFDTIETAMENTLSRDGSTPNHMLSSLDMNSHSIHNLGRATTLSSAMSLGQFLEYANTEESLTGVVPITWEFTSTGDSSYTLPLASTNKVDMYIISSNGIVISPTQYSVLVDEQRITFNTPPAIGEAIVVRLFGKIPGASPDSLVVNNLRASSIQTVVGLETVFNTPFPLDGVSTDIYLNGIKLVYPTDYSVGSTFITLVSPATAGDTIEIVSHSVVLAASDQLLAVQESVAVAEVAAAAAAQAVIDAAAEGAAAGAIAGSEGIAWSIQTTNYTTEHAEGIFADTTSGSFTITLPSTPTIGQYIHVVDVASKFSINNLIVARNGEYIMGLDEDLTILTKNLSVKFVYSGAAYGWRII